MNFSSLEYINTLRESGTVLQSSKYLINRCLKNIAFDKAKVIVELGMGNGCITKEILERCDNNTTIISFEVNKKFCSYCQNKFKNNLSLKILNKSAFDFQDILEQNNISEVDYIISSLPISLFDKNDTTKLLTNLKKTLKKEGHFIQYQYSLNHLKLIKNIFPKVTVDFTMLNIPPAFIYNCA
ncbi:class I SAM-dependent methyltransferase [Aquimarina sp. RZ0]|uniref:class I SAM-dependent methyltransferase n=1 Tax=Aquimarina sp. RZ0 TaxID=2607730 RepID=UPI0011F29B91|nr:methyltransferase domain-containing protein [Aquimarina sp. RZ0]KAA1241578.1 methyltransferase domain-containing protein [Aquimarina sp. RZ0]